MLLESHFVLPTSALGMMDVQFDSGDVCDQVPGGVTVVGKRWAEFCKGREPMIDDRSHSCGAETRNCLPGFCRYYKSKNTVTTFTWRIGLWRDISSFFGGSST